MPSFAVVIPTFNRPQWLRGAVRSVLNQSWRDFELIVVNDAGCDISGVLQSFSDPRVRCESHASNRGLAAARNTGIRAAQADYVALLDDDDLYFPNHLETAARFIGPSAPVVYTDAVRAVWRRKDESYELIDRYVPYSMDFERHKLLCANIAPVNCFVFSRALAISAGLFDESFGTLEDWEFWLRLSALTPFKHIAEQTAQVNFRTDGTTMSSSRQDETITNRKRILTAHMNEIQLIPNVREIMDEFNRIWALEERAMSLGAQAGS